MTKERPKPGTPEFDKWMLERSKARANKIFDGKPTDFDERGIVSGGEDSLSFDEDERDEKSKKR